MSLTLARATLRSLPVLIAAGCARWFATRPDQKLGLPEGVPPIEKDVFNQTAKALRLPIRWAKDETNPDQIDFDKFEIADSSPEKKYISNGQPTAAFFGAYRQILEHHRLNLVQTELAHGGEVEITTEMGQVIQDEYEGSMAKFLLNQVAPLVEYAYQWQLGALPYEGAATDVISHQLFERNHGPWCHHESDPHCSALGSFPQKRTPLYPQLLQERAGFCDTLAQEPTSKRLLDPFTVVGEDGPSLYATPYHSHPDVGPIMRQISSGLDRAADVGEKSSHVDPSFVAYLRATAKAYRGEGSWADADEAWLKMKGKWFARIAPDETDSTIEPCEKKATFQFWLGVADPSASGQLADFAKRKQALENRFATWAGPGYQVREVDTKVPDFIHVIMGTGQAHHPVGAVAGFALPNYEPWSAQMRNIIIANHAIPFRMIRRSYAEAFIDGSQLPYYRHEAPNENLVAHEFSHNLGPREDDLVVVRGEKVKVKDALGVYNRRVQELLAETAAVALAFDFREQGKITEEVLMSRLIAVVHEAIRKVKVMGFFAAGNRPHTYGQLSGVQLGWWSEKGALSFDPGTGKFKVNRDAIKQASEELVANLLKIQTTGDQVAIKKIFDRYTVDQEGLASYHHDRIIGNEISSATVALRYSPKWPDDGTKRDWPN